MHFVQLELIEIHCLRTLQIFGNEKLAAMDMSQFEYGCSPDQAVLFECCDMYIQSIKPFHFEIRMIQMRSAPTDMKPEQNVQKCLTTWKDWKI